MTSVRFRARAECDETDRSPIICCSLDVPGRQNVAVEPVELSTPRLHLRPYVAADAVAVLAACQDPDIQRWTTVPVPYHREDAEQFVTLNTKDGWKADTGHSFAAIDRASGELVASIGLVTLDFSSKVAEVGFWTVPAARRRGIASEMTRAVATWTFDDLAIQRLEWVAEVGNHGSRQVAESVGFTVEGTLRSRLARRDGTRADAWIGSLLPGELR